MDTEGCKSKSVNVKMGSFEIEKYTECKIFKYVFYYL